MCVCIYLYKKEVASIHPSKHIHTYTHTHTHTPTELKDAIAIAEQTREEEDCLIIDCGEWRTVWQLEMIDIRDRCSAGSINCR